MESITEEEAAQLPWIATVESKHNHEGLSAAEPQLNLGISRAKLAKGAKVGKIG
jgi:hypothetical protein